MFWTEEELGLLQGTTVAQNATVRKMGALSFTDAFLWESWTNIWQIQEGKASDVCTGAVLLSSASPDNERQLQLAGRLAAHTGGF